MRATIDANLKGATILIRPAVSDAVIDIPWGRSL